MMAKDWRLALVAIYAVVLIGMMIDIGTLWSAFSIGVALVMIAPIALLCIWPGQALVKGIGAAVIGGLGLLMVIDTMYLSEPDGQSALVFLLAPILQVVAAGVFALAVFIGVRVKGKDE